MEPEITITLKFEILPPNLFRHSLHVLSRRVLPSLFCHTPCVLFRRCALPAVPFPELHSRSLLCVAYVSASPVPVHRPCPRLTLVARVTPVAHVACIGSFAHVPASLVSFHPSCPSVIPVAQVAFVPASLALPASPPRPTSPVSPRSSTCFRALGFQPEPSKFQKTKFRILEFGPKFRISGSSPK